jgi:hypothetical protein
MPRITKLVAIGYPHHITQRGNRHQTTFFNTESDQTYLEFIAIKKAGCDIEDLVSNRPMLEKFPNWARFIETREALSGSALKPEKSDRKSVRATLRWCEYLRKIDEPPPQLCTATP